MSGLVTCASCGYKVEGYLDPDAPSPASLFCEVCDAVVGSAPSTEKGR